MNNTPNSHTNTYCSFLRQFHLWSLFIICLLAPVYGADLAVDFANPEGTYSRHVFGGGNPRMSSSQYSNGYNDWGIRSLRAGHDGNWNALINIDSVDDWYNNKNNCQDPSTWNWNGGIYGNDFIKSSHAAGIKVCLDYSTPDWNSQSGGKWGVPIDYDVYEEVLVKLIQHYEDTAPGTLLWIECHNEPNLGNRFPGGNASKYVDMLDRCIRAVERSANPNILVGGPVWSTTLRLNNTSAKAYLDEIFNDDRVKNKIDFVSWHEYGQKSRGSYFNDLDDYIRGKIGKSLPYMVTEWGSHKSKGSSNNEFLIRFLKNNVIAAGWWEFQKADNSTDKWYFWNGNEPHIGAKASFGFMANLGIPDHDGTFYYTSNSEAFATINPSQERIILTPENSGTITVNNVGISGTATVQLYGIDDGNTDGMSVSEELSLSINSGTLVIPYNLGGRDFVGIRIMGPSVPVPTVSINEPVDGAEFVVGDTISMAATASIEGGETITKVEFFEDGNLLGEDGSSPWSWSWNNVPEGTHTLTAVAHSSNNQSSTSLGISVVIISTDPGLSITNPQDGGVTDTEVSITFDALNWFNDGEYIEYRVDEGTPQSHFDTNPIGLTNLSDGSHTVVLELVDTNGESIGVSDSVTFTVDSLIDNQAPVVSATISNTKVDLGSLVTLDATDSSDPDNGPSPLSFYWSQTAGPSTTITNADESLASVVLNTAGSYSFEVTVSDGHRSSTDSVSVIASVPGQDALIVTHSGSLNAAESAISDRLESFGWVVSTSSSGNVSESLAESYDLVLVSSTINSGDVNSKLRNAVVPVVSWEAFIFDSTDMGMVGSSSSDYGYLSSDQVVIESPSNALTAGLEGTLTIADSSIEMAFGRPASNAIIGARSGGEAVLFGYDVGDAMPGGIDAPERRVGIFLFNDGFTSLNENGLALFDNAIEWVTNSSDTVLSQWVADNLNSLPGGTSDPLADLDADADGDGITNLAEFFHDYDPMVNDGGKETIWLSFVDDGGSSYAIVHVRRRDGSLVEDNAVTGNIDGVRYTLEWSTDGQTWNSTNSTKFSEENTPVLNGDGSYTVSTRFTDAVTTGVKLFRIQMEVE